MPQLYLITVPGLLVPADWARIHDRLLDDFPRVTDVLATTITGTVLIVYRGRPDANAWLDAITEEVLRRRLRVGRRASPSTAPRHRGAQARAAGRDPRE
jgi:hypothetical protein